MRDWSKRVLSQKELEILKIKREIHDLEIEREKVVEDIKKAEREYLEAFIEWLKKKRERKWEEEL